MTEKMKVNFQIQMVTDEKLEEIARLTYRSKGAVIDWLVNEKYAELAESESQPAQVTPAATGS